MISFPTNFLILGKKKIGKNLDISFLCKIQWSFLFFEIFVKFFTSQSWKKKTLLVTTMLQPTRKKKLNYMPTWFSPSLSSVINFHLIIPIIIPIYFYYTEFFSLWVCWILDRNNVSSDYISKIPHMLKARLSNLAKTLSCGWLQNWLKHCLVDDCQIG
jgi:hypothetical protein